MPCAHGYGGFLRCHSALDKFLNNNKKMLRLFNCLSLRKFSKKRVRCRRKSHRFGRKKRSRHVRSSSSLIKYLNSICLIKQKRINHLLAFVIVAKRFMFQPSWDMMSLYLVSAQIDVWKEKHYEPISQLMKGKCLRADVMLWVSYKFIVVKFNHPSKS